MTDAAIDALDAAVRDRDEAWRAALEWRKRHDDLADKLAGLELAAIGAADTLRDAVEGLVDDEDEPVSSPPQAARVVRNPAETAAAGERHDYVMPLSTAWVTSTPCVYMVSADNEPYRTCRQPRDAAVHQPAAQVTPRQADDGGPTTGLTPPHNFDQCCPGVDHCRRCLGREDDPVHSPPRGADTAAPEPTCTCDWVADPPGIPHRNWCAIVEAEFGPAQPAAGDTAAPEPTTEDYLRATATALGVDPDAAVAEAAASRFAREDWERHVLRAKLGAPFPAAGLAHLRAVNDLADARARLADLRDWVGLHHDEDCADEEDCGPAGPCWFAGARQILDRPAADGDQL